MCSGTGYHTGRNFGYRVRGIEICECVEQELEDSGTGWVNRNLNRAYEFNGLDNGNGPMATDDYIFYCSACRRTYEIIECAIGIMVNGTKEFIGGIHYHQLPAYGKEHIECPNCLHGANTVRIVTYQPNGNMFRTELTNEMEKKNEGRTNG
ncbi:MAG: hypothetical protein H8D65_00970 [Spirochaetes bacterium]|nr:hypothetical protein [Spirochaetota bacterium]